ncbi:AcrR family transcriptional regulator [Allocatelliglobosispora scoriae]|uniref:AcrR family transcriptional regulator n=1 Tax=Allocatelliglobosispora scoriae TaxID=643052 RepID=A0A841BQR4_9ACTN|nr:TetR/AcrR family transcriptional regulator [Allocatelliglobosispora scoriae]MBB5869529.1 AcrR family transcriptional regulator [Allocatelliglobosispora scoriae]
MSDTKTKLMDGAIAAIKEHGIAGASARAIATSAGVNQALVFYHFGTVDELLTAACQRATAERVETYAERFAGVTSLRGLLAVGRQLHDEEQELGNVTLLAQLLAGARTNPVLAAACAQSLKMWSASIEAVLTRVLTGSPFADLADIGGLSRAISAAFLGLELYEGVDPAGAAQALDALDQLGILMEVVDELSPMAKKLVRSRLRKATR